MGEGLVAGEVAKLLNRRLEEVGVESSRPPMNDATEIHRESSEAQD